MTYLSNRLTICGAILAAMTIAGCAGTAPADPAHPNAVTAWRPCFKDIGYTVKRPAADMINLSRNDKQDAVILNRDAPPEDGFDDITVGRWTITFWDDGGKGNRQDTIECTRRIGATRAQLQQGHP